MLAVGRVGEGMTLSSGLGLLGPCLPQDGAFSPGVLCMCFEDHFCIVRSEEKKYSDMVEKKIFTYPGGP